VRDYGAKKRKYPTPSTDDISQNIQDLLDNEKWSSKDPSATLKELSKLQVHAKQVGAPLSEVI
jgi:hypothetical protein